MDDGGPDSSHELASDMSATAIVFAAEFAPELAAAVVSDAFAADLDAAVLAAAVVPAAALADFGPGQEEVA